MKQHCMKRTRIAAVALLGTLGAASVMPAHAETTAAALKRAESEIQALKQEMAEQRALIKSQKEAIEKIKLKNSVPLIVEIPDRHLTYKSAEDIEQYINRSIGI